MHQFVAPIIAVAMGFGLAGCSWQQAYSAGQEWQRNACNRLLEQTERERCLSSSSMSYDDYRRRSDGTRKD
jgi:hypothetical protein